MARAVRLCQLVACVKIEMICMSIRAVIRKDIPNAMDWNKRDFSKIRQYYLDKFGAEVHCSIYG